MRTETLDDFVAAVFAERGGEDAFTVVQRRLVFALAAAMKQPTETDIVAVARILDQLPPIVGARSDGPHHADMSRLDDDELDQLETLMAKCSVPGADSPVFRDSLVVDLSRQVDDLQRELSERDRLLGILEQQVHVENRLARNAFDAAKDAQAEVVALKVTLADAVKRVTPHPSPSDNPGRVGDYPPVPTNVIPLVGNGSAAINAGIRERYPHMSFPGDWR
jgi:hypothetical protein